MALDINKLMNETLPARMLQHSEELKAIDGKFQIEITGVGNWHLSVVDGDVSCSATVKTADCTITATPVEFQNLLRNPAFNGPRLCCLNRIKVVGNQVSALKIPKIYSICDLSAD
jgi:hypothetical protein